jgi:hypothetical protein
MWTSGRIRKERSQETLGCLTYKNKKPVQRKLSLTELSRTTF